MPLINTVSMKTGSEARFGAGYNVLPKKRLDAKTLVTTPNSDVIYAMSYVHLGDGPLVVDAPPKLQAILFDFWQRPIQGPIVRGNSDGTIDLYFAATAPADKGKNWLAIVPGRGFFVVVRLYSPTKAAFDGSWKPSDFHGTT